MARRDYPTSGKEIRKEWKEFASLMQKQMKKSPYFSMAIKDILAGKPLKDVMKAYYLDGKNAKQNLEALEKLQRKWRRLKEALEEKEKRGDKKFQLHEQSDGKWGGYKMDMLASVVIPFQMLQQYALEPNIYAQGFEGVAKQIFDKDNDQMKQLINLLNRAKSTAKGTDKSNIRKEIEDQRLAVKGGIAMKALQIFGQEKKRLQAIDGIINKAAKEIAKVNYHIKDPKQINDILNPPDGVGKRHPKIKDIQKAIKHIQKQLDLPIPLRQEELKRIWQAKQDEYIAKIDPKVLNQPVLYGHLKFHIQDLKKNIKNLDNNNAAAFLKVLDKLHDINNAMLQLGRLDKSHLRKVFKGKKGKGDHRPSKELRDNLEIEHKKLLKAVRKHLKNNSLLIKNIKFRLNIEVQQLIANNADPNVIAKANKQILKIDEEMNKFEEARNALNKVPDNFLNRKARARAEFAYQNAVVRLFGVIQAAREQLPNVNPVFSASSVWDSQSTSSLSSFSSATLVAPVVAVPFPAPASPVVLTPEEKQVRNGAIAALGEALKLVAQAKQLAKKLEGAGKPIPNNIRDMIIGMDRNDFKGQLDNLRGNPSVKAIGENVREFRLFLNKCREIINQEELKAAASATVVAPAVAAVPFPAATSPVVLAPAEKQVKDEMIAVLEKLLNHIDQVDQLVAELTKAGKPIPTNISDMIKEMSRYKDRYKAQLDYLRDNPSAKANKNGLQQITKFIGQCERIIIPKINEEHQKLKAGAAAVFDDDELVADPARPSSSPPPVEVHLAETNAAAAVLEQVVSAEERKKLAELFNVLMENADDDYMFFDAPLGIDLIEAELRNLSKPLGVNRYNELKQIFDKWASGPGASALKREDPAPPSSPPPPFPGVEVHTAQTFAAGGEEVALPSSPPSPLPAVEVHPAQTFAAGEEEVDLLSPPPLPADSGLTATGDEEQEEELPFGPPPAPPVSAPPPSVASTSLEEEADARVMDAELDKIEKQSKELEELMKDFQGQDGLDAANPSAEKKEDVAPGSTGGPPKPTRPVLPPSSTKPKVFPSAPVAQPTAGTAASPISPQPALGEARPTRPSVPDQSKKPQGWPAPVPGIPPTTGKAASAGPQQPAVAPPAPPDNFGEWQAAKLRQQQAQAAAKPATPKLPKVTATPTTQEMLVKAMAQRHEAMQAKKNDRQPKATIADPQQAEAAKEAQRAARLKKAADEAVKRKSGPSELGRPLTKEEETETRRVAIAQEEEKIKQDEKKQKEEEDFDQDWDEEDSKINPSPTPGRRY